MTHYRLPFGHKETRVDRRGPRLAPALRIALRCRR
jgi:hypothetical protein